MGHNFKWSRMSALVLVILVLSSCGGKDPDKDGGPDLPVKKTNNTKSKAEYTLYAKAINRTLIGNNIDVTNWDEELRIIYLGPDKTIEPLGTLTLVFNPEITDDFVLTEATFSVSDTKFGTAEEINARTFTLDSGQGGSCSFITVKEIGQNFIQVDTFCIPMIEVITDPARTAESLQLSGKFIALEI